MLPDLTKALMCGDDIVGFVDVTGIDHYWTLGTFEPGPAYQRYARLFDRERELSDDGAANDAWLEALEAINDLGLTFQGKRIRDFKIDSRGVCEFKSGAFA